MERLLVLLTKLQKKDWYNVYVFLLHTNQKMKLFCLTTMVATIIP
jgi:hypothetical protein